MKFHAAKKILAGVHRDERGNIAVLMLLAAISLWGLLGLIWNAGEYGAKRQKVQIAADCAANAVEVWRARAMNAITASNIVIGENASAESVMLAVPDAGMKVGQRLTAEQQSATRLMERAQKVLDNPNSTQSQVFQALLEKSVLNDVQSSLPVQQSYLPEFNQIGTDAALQMTPDELAQQRAAIFENQKAMFASTAAAISSQLSKIAQAYNVDVTLAVPVDASDVDGQVMLSIQLPSGANISIPLPIKEVPGGPNLENDMMAAAPTLSDPDSGEPITIQQRGWGAIVDPPMNRFVIDRVRRDARLVESNLSAAPMLGSPTWYMYEIDVERARLLTLINNDLNSKNAQPWQVPIYAVVAQEVLGTGADAAWNNPFGRSQGWGFHSGFAINTWNGSVWHFTQAVLHDLGEQPQYVLSTYDTTQPVPNTDVVSASVYQRVWAEVFNDNVSKVAVQIFNARVKAALAANPQMTRAEQDLLNLQLQGPAYTEASRRGGVTDVAAQAIATDIAGQWVSRGWPFEITPPRNGGPMPPGILKADRLKFYTVLAAARSTDPSSVPTTSAAPTLQGLFGKGEKLVAYAQAETFNWMEFNTPYGKSDGNNGDVVGYGIWFPVDSYLYVWRSPDDTGNPWGSPYEPFAAGPTPNYSWPAPWRISTPGGWSWNNRLAFADGLSAAMKNPQNTEFVEFMDSAQVMTDDEVVLSTLNQH